MQGQIACRLAAYGRYAERGWTHLPTLGIRHVELPMPARGECAGLRARLDAHGLAASSVQARCDLADPGVLDGMKPQLEACAALGAGICMLVARADGVAFAVCVERLRAIGDAARRCGVVVALETHPPLVTNGEVGRVTIEAVGHPHVGINWDPANVYFYNEGLTAGAELQKVLPYVAAVHLKDTTGRPGDYNYPPLGAGVVDFAHLFETLGACGFAGPFTLELEGSRAPARGEEEQLRFVAGAADYLRRLGALD